MLHGVRTLPRLVPAPAGKPVRPEAEDNQQLMQAIAREPSTWSPALARLTEELFDAMAPTWANERGGYRPAPLLDALQRGGLEPRGRCLELASGTGVLTPHLQAVWEAVVCIDLSMQMLQRQPHGRRLQADASLLPFADQSFDVVVIGDGPLFAAEVVRVLSDRGAVLVTNALGAGAPYYLPTPVIGEAFAHAAPRASWSAIESEASWGSWIVLHRDDAAR